MTVVCYLDGSTLNFKGGGGSVAVEGLTADVVLAGNTVTVKQGSKTVESVTGALDVLALGSGGSQPVVYIVWNGTQYVSYSVFSNPNVTVAGTPRLVVGNGCQNLTICGVTFAPYVNNSPVTVSAAAAMSNVIQGSGSSFGYGDFVVLGTK